MAAARCHAGRTDGRGRIGRTMRRSPTSVVAAFIFAHAFSLGPWPRHRIRSRHAAVPRKGTATRQLREQQHHLQPLVPATALASSDNSSLAAHVPGSTSETVPDSFDDVSVVTISSDSSELMSSNVAATKSSSPEPFGPRTHRRYSLRKAQLPLFVGTNHPT